jgi:hypothetical protein
VVSNADDKQGANVTAEKFKPDAHIFDITGVLLPHRMGERVPLPLTSLELIKLETGSTDADDDRDGCGLSDGCAGTTGDTEYVVVSDGDRDDDLVVAGADGASCDELSDKDVVMD